MKNKKKHVGSNPEFWSVHLQDSWPNTRCRQPSSGAKCGTSGRARAWSLGRRSFPQSNLAIEILWCHGEFWCACCGEFWKHCDVMMQTCMANSTVCRTWPSGNWSTQALRSLPWQNSRFTLFICFTYQLERMRKVRLTLLFWIRHISTTGHLGIASEVLCPGTNLASALSRGSCGIFSDGVVLFKRYKTKRSLRSRLLLSPEKSPCVVCNGMLVCWYAPALIKAV